MLQTMLKGGGGYTYLYINMTPCTSIYKKASVNTYIYNDPLCKFYIQSPLTSLKT